MKTGLPTTLGDKTYNFIEIKENENAEHLSGVEIPYYLSVDAQPLTRFYEPIDGDVFALVEGKKYLENTFTRNRFPMTFKPQDKPDLQIPHPINFKTKEEFQKAFTTWYADAMTFYSSVLLPRPITGEYFVPELPKIFSKEEKNNSARFRTFKPNLWPLLPKNYISMIDMIYSKEQIDPDEKFAEQVPKRDPIFHKHHITSTDQWSGQIIPAEPLPIFYDYFDEYELAYKRWASLTYNNIKIAPIPPSAMGGIIALDEVHEESIQPLSESIPIDPELLKGFEWVPKGETNAEAIAQKLQSLIPKEGQETTANRSCQDVLYVTGVDMKKFVEDNLDKGIYAPTLLSEGVCRPLIYAFGKSESDLVHAEELVRLDLPDFGYISKLLEYEYTQEQLQKIMTLPIKETTLGLFFSNILTSTANIKLLNEISQYAPEYPYRIYNLIYAIMAHDTKCAIIKTLSTQENLEFFDMFIGFANLYSPNRIDLIPIINSKSNRQLSMINRFYLLSHSLSLFKDYKGHVYYREATEQCRLLAFEVAKLLHDNTFLPTIQESKVGTDQYKNLLMIIQCQAPNLHRLLLGQSCLKWICLSDENHPSRPIVIWTIAHTPCIHSVAHLFLKYGFGKGINTKEMLQNMDTNTCYFVTYILTYLLHSTPNQHLQFTSGFELLSIFDDVAQSQSETVTMLLVPIASILCSKHLITKFDTNDYQNKLVSASTQLCNNLSKVTTKVYQERLRAISQFAIYESCASAMCKVPDFDSTMADHLNASDSAMLQTNWNFIQLLAQFPNVLSNVLSDDKVKDSFGNIVKKGNSLSMRKLFIFSNYIMKEKETKEAKFNPLRKAFCDLLTKQIGPVATLFKTRETAFKDDPSLKELVKSFIKNIYTSKNRESTEEFISMFIKHSGLTKKQIERDLKD